MLTRKGTAGQRHALAIQLRRVRRYLRQREHIARVAGEWGCARGMIIGYNIPLRSAIYRWMRRHIWDTL